MFASLSVFFTFINANVNQRKYESEKPDSFYLTKSASRINQIKILVLIIIIGMFKAEAQLLKDYPFTPVPFTKVSINDKFWAPRIVTNREVTIPDNFKKSEDTGRIKNFAVAGGLEEGEFEGIYYNDSDVFKIIEGARFFKY